MPRSTPVLTFAIIFFRGLCGKARLHAVRRVLCFLADQEDTHVELLRRLLGRSPSPG